MLIAMADNGSSKTRSASHEDLSSEVNAVPHYISKRKGMKNCVPLSGQIGYMAPAERSESN